MNDGICSLCSPDLVIFDCHNTLLPTTYTNNSITVSEDLCDGAEDVIKALNTNNIKLAVVSDFFKYAVKKQIEASSVSEYFDLVAGFDTWRGDDYEYYPKPSVTLGDNIKKELNLNKESCIWMIGDGAKDIEFAANNSFEFIGYDNNNITNDEYLNYTSYINLLNDLQQCNYW